MPIYAYKCSACDNVMEVMAKMSDPAPTRCEHCGAVDQLQKLISRTAFKLKGDGWYSSGYEGKSNRNSSTSNSSSDSTASSTPDNSSSNS